MDYITLRSKIEPFENNKLDKENKKTLSDPYQLLPDSFLEDLSFFLQQIEPEFNTEGKVSAEKSFRAITNDQVKAALWISYSCPRSAFPVSRSKVNNKYHALTPIPMLAMKTRQGILYEQWDKEDPWLYAALGKMLRELTENPIEEFSRDKITPELLKQALTVKTGVKRGEVRPATTYTMSSSKVLDGDGVIILPYNSNASRMLLQTWKAHPSNRLPGVMILDPWDWDFVPTPIDDSYTEEKEEKEVTEDLPW